MNHWGRIFFDDPMNPKIIKAQPLENHINNCCRILEKFDKSCFISESLSTQMQEVMIHDEIKTDRKYSHRTVFKCIINRLKWICDVK